MKALDINPKKNPAFSKRLYNWCKREGADVYIFRNQNSAFSLYGSLYIGRLNACGCCPNEFTGAQIASVLQGERDSFCFINLKLEPLPDIEESYLRIGRCALDPDHTVPFIDERWDRYGVLRVCKWCGIKQFLRFTTKTVQTTSWEVV